MFNRLSGKELTTRFARCVWRGSFATGPEPARSIVVEGSDSLEPSVRGQRDLLDAHFRVLEQFVAALLQGFAAFIKPDRLIQRNRAFFELIDDLFEFGERRFE